MQGKNKRREENRGQQLQSSFALLEHFPKSIFYMLYTISKLRKSRIQRFKPCTIWSWNEEDMAFGRQLHQVEGQFRTLRNWNFNVRNLKWMAAVKSRWSPAFEVDFATCELRYQHAKLDSKLRNQLAKFSQVTMQRAKLGYFVPTLFLLIFLWLNFHFLLVFSHSCNSLARKYPWKGKLPSYINSLVNTKKGTLGELFPGHQLMYILHLRKYRDLFGFTFSLLFSWKPNNLWGCFPRGWEAKLLVSWSEGS